MAESGNKQNLRQVVMSRILDEIVAGKMAAGSRLPTEREFAVRWDVSRTVVRDAIKTLSGLGMVETRQGHGTFVATAAAMVSGDLFRNVAAAALTHGDAISNLFEIRLALEPHTAAAAALRATYDDKVALADLALANDAQDSRPRANSAYPYDSAFHRMVSEAAGNPALAMLVNNIRGLLSYVRIKTVVEPRRAATSSAEHVAIANAILAGDPERARAAMYVHVSHVRDVFPGSGRALQGEIALTDLHNERGTGAINM